MSPLTRLPLAAAAAAAAALLAGCSHAPAPIPVRTWHPPQHHTTAPTDRGQHPTPGRPTVPDSMREPLTEADLGSGWHNTNGETAGDWMRPCGVALGVATLQTSSRAQALTGPEGVQVRARVADYRSAGDLQHAITAARAALTGCPLTTVDGKQQTTTTMAPPAGIPGVGAVTTTQSASGVTLDSVGYWLVEVGGETVEVYAHATFAPAAPDPMTAFSTALRNAAMAKAAGERVPVVPVPPVATSRPGSSSQDPNAQGASGPGGVAGTGPEAGTTGGSFTETPEGTVPKLAPGVGGESGPGTVDGYMNPTAP